MVQARQLNHQHADEHYASAVFRYLRELAVKFREIATLVCLDDKHTIKVGEPGYPMAAVDRGKSVLVGKDVSFSVANHDFSCCKIIPSAALTADVPSSIQESFYHGQLVVTIKDAALVVDVPSSVQESFYHGQLVVTLKDATLQPSSPLRHVAELTKVLRAVSINTI